MLTSPKLRFVLATFVLISNATAAQRLFVEPFTTKAGSETLHDDVVAELRKLHSVSLATSESNADIILGGGGDIWIKGYTSLNPRSGRSPANGNPVYDGYLAVELREKTGVTLWSYLVTPGANATDVAKDLSKRIAKRVAEAIEKGHAAPAATPLSQPATVLKGAGATFPYPVYSKWFTNYRRENPNLEITYDPIGSEAGIRTLAAKKVDFGASDSAQSIKEDFLFFPAVIGAVVPIVNLPGLAAEISFTPEALAGIFLGKIRKWNDPILKQANKGLPLPDIDIVVVHRADGSGTSYAFTDYLASTVPEWKTQVGAQLSPKWPTGKPATGNDGVAKLVKELGGSIGYVEFIYALQNHLSFGKVRNRNGEYIAASLESMAVAAAQTSAISDDLRMSLVNAPGAGAYPISSFSWLVIPTHIADDNKRSAITGFLRWMLGPGQTQAAALGYLALPKDLIAKESAAIANVR